MKLKKVLSLTLALALLVCALSACTKAPASEDGANAPAASDGDAAATPTELTISGDDITTFNPFMAVNGPDIFFMMHIIGESLILCNDDFTYEPLLAESYDVSDDGLVYTFHLRSGVTFHDGSALDAGDVKYSIESAASGFTAASLAERIVSVETPDDLTVVVTLNSYLSTFLITLFTFVPIMPEGIFEGDYDFDAHPIGTGPYEFVSYTAGDSLMLKKNENYYLDNSELFDTIKYRVIADPSTALVSLETGDLDFLRIAASDISLVENNEEIALESYYQYSTVIAWMDNAVAPFDDLNVRLALNHAVNRAALSTAKGAHGYSPAATYVAPCCYGYSDDFEPYSYDTELAKQLIADSKYNAEDISFTIATTEEYKIEAQFIQEALRDIGITNIDIELIEPSTFQAGIMTKEYPFGISTVGCGLMANAASLLFASASPVNMMSYNNPEVDECYNTADTTPDEAERLKALHRIDELLEADAPCLPLLWTMDTIAYRVNEVNIDKALDYNNSSSEILPQFVTPVK